MALRLPRQCANVYRTKSTDSPMQAGAEKDGSRTGEGADENARFVSKQPNGPHLTVNAWPASVVPQLSTAPTKHLFFPRPPYVGSDAVLTLGSDDVLVVAATAALGDYDRLHVSRFGLPRLAQFSCSGRGADNAAWCSPWCGCQCFTIFVRRAFAPVPARPCLDPWLGEFPPRRRCLGFGPCRRLCHHCHANASRAAGYLSTGLS